MKPLTEAIARAMISAYEYATDERLPTADGEDYRIVRAMYEAAACAALLAALDQEG